MMMVNNACHRQYLNSINSNQRDNHFYNLDVYSCLYCIASTGFVDLIPGKELSAQTFRMDFKCPYTKWFRSLWQVR